MARKAKVAPVAFVESTIESEVIDQTVAQVVETNVVTELVVDEVVEASPSELLALLTPDPKPAEVEPVVVVKKVAKNDGVGKMVRELIADGLSNTEILKRVHEEYDNENTTYACVAWYRNKVKKANAIKTTTKAVEQVEKFLEADESETGLSDEEIEDEVLTDDELLDQVGQ